MDFEHKKRTRISFSQRHSINITHDQKTFTVDKKFISFNLTFTLSDIDLDLTDDIDLLSVFQWNASIQKAFVFDLDHDT